MCPSRLFIPNESLFEETRDSRRAVMPIEPIPPNIRRLKWEVLGDAEHLHRRLRSVRTARTKKRGHQPTKEIMPQRQPGCARNSSAGDDNQPPLADSSL